MTLPPIEAWVFDQFYWPREGADRFLIPFPGRCWDPQVGLQQYADHLRYLRRADELGFDGVCLTEHHFAPFGLPSPNIVAAALAVQTSHAKLVLMGNCIPLHAHPVRLAEELAMIDLLSNGRLVAGMLRGGFTEWYAYGIDATTARERFEEAWELMVDCWVKPEPFAWNGNYFQYPDISITPRPIQQPHPPMVMPASTAESIEWCARHRTPMASSFAPTESMVDNFDYYRHYAQTECGWTPGPEHIMFSRQLYVARTDEQAREEAAPHLEAFWREIPVARKMSDPVERYRASQRTERSFAYKKGHSADGPYLAETLAAGGVPSFDWLIEKGLAIIGSPDTVMRQIRHQQERLGAGTMMIYSPFGTLPVEMATRSIELFAKEILPSLKKSA